MNTIDYFEEHYDFLSNLILGVGNISDFDYLEPYVIFFRNWKMPRSSPKSPKPKPTNPKYRSATNRRKKPQIMRWVSQLSTLQHLHHHRHMLHLHLRTPLLHLQCQSRCQPHLRWSQ